MFRFPLTVTFRLALGYGLLMLVSMAVLAGVLYLGTVGVLNSGMDGKLWSLSQRLTARAGNEGVEALRQEVQNLLEDGIDSDTEVYDLLGADGRLRAGNLMAVPDDLPLNQLSDMNVVRAGRPSYSRLLAHRLPDGGLLVVGRDLDDLLRMENLVLRSLGVGSALSVLIGLGGAVLFRRMIENRLTKIRKTAARISQGDMSWRVPQDKNQDEFSRLNRDINMMLDRIQTLMDGVRDVSNAIAHDLRTPLGRVRAKLDQALRSRDDSGALPLAVGEVIGDIDDLVGVFQKILDIAEVESGSRRHSLGAVVLGEVVTDLVELYDALADEKGVALNGRIQGTPIAWGDRDLLAMAVSNLLDNALKYAGEGAAITISAEDLGDRVRLSVADDGPGIPAAQRQAVLKRFVRLEPSRHLPGNGLGLSMVAAIAGIHDGLLEFEDAAPGLMVRLYLPKPPVNLSKR